jgi:hypothetical protein
VQENRLTEDECIRVFAALFPTGLGGLDVFAEIAPEGWEQSPLRLVFHPPLERVYEETVQLHENIEGLMKAGAPPRPAPTLQEVRASYVETALAPEREMPELVARCVWDVFSDNHEVLAPDGRIVDLGSFRGSAGFIANLLNGQVAGARYDYMDFYMGTIWVAGRADLTPVYEMIFRRLKFHGCDWAYHFPRLALVDLRPLRDALDSATNEWEGYDPSAAVQKQQEDEEHDRQVAELRQSLDEMHQEAVREAQHAPPPRTVLAYRNVFGSWPRGWPPVPGVE